MLQSLFADRVASPILGHEWNVCEVRPDDRDGFLHKVSRQSRWSVLLLQDGRGDLTVGDFHVGAHELFHGSSTSADDRH